MQYNMPIKALEVEMPRRKAELLTHSELEILEVLWKAERPITRFEIEDAAPARRRSTSGIYAILQRLEERGAIKKAGSVLRGSKKTALYVPAMTYEDYLRYVLKHIYIPESGESRTKLIDTLIALAKEDGAAK